MLSKLKKLVESKQNEVSDFNAAKEIQGDLDVSYIVTLSKQDNLIENLSKLEKGMV